jgi:hypothetical protein
VRLDDRAIDHQSVGDLIAPSESGENIFPDAPLGPSDEAIVDRFLRTLVGKAVRPSPAPFEHSHNTAKHSTIINGCDV